jgi:hypothetical protein
MPTVSELNALPYTGGSPASKGLAAEDYRKQYRIYGEPIRWWKALPVPVGTPGRERNGYLYEEQTLAPEIRVLIYQNRRDIQGTPFGSVTAGQSMISVMPDEVHLARGDRILATQRLQRARARIRREAGNSDVLPIPHAVELVWAVGAGTTFVAGEDFALSSDGRAIEWLGALQPEAGQEYGLEWTYRPMYVFLGQMNQEHALGTDGLLLPQIGLLHQGENLPL